MRTRRIPVRIRSGSRGRTRRTRWLSATCGVRRFGVLGRAAWRPPEIVNSLPMASCSGSGGDRQIHTDYGRLAPGPKFRGTRLSLGCAAGVRSLGSYPVENQRNQTLQIWIPGRPDPGYQTESIATIGNGNFSLVKIVTNGEAQFKATDRGQNVQPVCPARNPGSAPLPKPPMGAGCKESDVWPANQI